jgi:hypothetical protein
LQTTYSNSLHYYDVKSLRLYTILKTKKQGHPGCFPQYRFNFTSKNITFSLNYPTKTNYTNILIFTTTRQYFCIVLQYVWWKNKYYFDITKTLYKGVENLNKTKQSQTTVDIAADYVKVMSSIICFSIIWLNFVYILTTSLTCFGVKEINLTIENIIIRFESINLKLHARVFRPIWYIGKRICLPLL